MSSPVFLRPLGYNSPERIYTTMSAFGLSKQGKKAQQGLTEIPDWFWEQAQKDFGRSDEEYTTGQGLRNDFIAYIREMIANGVGSPEEILALAEQIMPGVSEAIGNRQDRTNRLRGQAQTIPGTDQVRGEMSSVLDQEGGNITGTYDDVTGNTRDTIKRRMNASEGYGKDRVSNIRDVSTGMNTLTDEIQGKMSGNLDATMLGLQGKAGEAFGGLIDASDPAFNEMLKRVEAFKPGGEARASRVGRSFNPAYASTVNRLRRGGVDLTSPEAIASLTRVDTARANAMDDSLAGDTERYVTASNSISRDKLGNKQDLVLQKLANSQGLSLDQLKTQLGLDKDYRNTKNDIAYQTGKDFRGELSAQEKTQQDLDLLKLKMDTDASNTAADRTTTLNNDRANLIKLGRQMGMEDFEIQQLLEDRANEDDLMGFKLKNEQFDRGMQFRLSDLARKDNAANALGNTANSAMDRSSRLSQQGSNNAGNAYDGYQNTFTRESANAGWLKKLIGSLGGAAADYFLPGSGSIVRGATGAGGGGSSANPFTSFGNLSKRQGASSLPLKTGAPMNPYGGTTNPTFKGWNPQPDWGSYKPVMFAEGGVVDEPTMGMLGEAGETEYVVPESKAPQFSAATLATGAPPDPSMIPGQMDMDMQAPAPAPKPTKLQIKKLDEAIKAEQSVNKSWDERVRDAMRMGKLMDPESEPIPAVNSKAMKMKHASDARLEGLLDMKTMMLEMSGVGVGM